MIARILLIDDDEAITSVAAASLRARGHDVIIALDGREGILMADKFRPEVVITDLVMPGQEGIETIIALRRKYSDVGIIAISGAGHAAAYFQLALRLGADSVLSKPFSRGELDIAIGEALTIRRAFADAPLEHVVSSRPFTFIVLDDDADSRFLNARALRKQFPGCYVIECPSLREALDACASPRVDAVITDHHLGYEEGASFIAALRTRKVTCPVLMVTGNSNPAVHAKAYAVGATRVFGPSDRDFAPYLRSLLVRE